MPYDAIVVGARCAGAPTAMLLARTGLRVLALDRATFPSDTVSGHGIKLAGVTRLARWGLLDKLLDSGCPPMRTVAVDLGVARHAPPPIPPGLLKPMGPRRVVLDDILVTGAKEAGAEIRQGWSVTGLTWDGDRVTGVRARGPDGQTYTESANLVIGADGLNSFVARQVKAHAYHEMPTASIAYYGYWTGLPTDGLAMWFRPGCATGIFPTHDGETLAFVQAPTSQRALYRTDLDNQYHTALRSFPELADRLEGATLRSRIVGKSQLPTYFRTPFGPGWALVGDAGHHKDPLVARGISDAFRDAELLRDAVYADLSGELPLDKAMLIYQQTRDTASRQVADLNARLAALDETPDQMIQTAMGLMAAEEEADQLLESLDAQRPQYDSQHYRDVWFP